MLVAERDGAGVGLLESDRPAPERAVIRKVYVTPDQQRTGVARALVGRYRANAGAPEGMVAPDGRGAAGAPEVMVEHDARDAAAAAFFARLGFAAYEVERGTVRRLVEARPT